MTVFHLYFNSEPSSMSSSCYTLPEFTSQEIIAYLEADHDEPPSSKVLNLIVNTISQHLLDHHIPNSFP